MRYKQHSDTNTLTHLHTATLVKMGAQAHMLATYQAQMRTNKDDHLHIIRQTDMWLPKCSRTCTKTKKQAHTQIYTDAQCIISNLLSQLSDKGSRDDQTIGLF